MNRKTSPTGSSMSKRRFGTSVPYIKTHIPKIVTGGDVETSLRCSKNHAKNVSVVQFETPKRCEIFGTDSEAEDNWHPSN